MSSAVHKPIIGASNPLVVVSEMGTGQVNSTANQTSVTYTSITIDGDYLVVALTMESEGSTTPRITGVTIDPGGAAIAMTEVSSISETSGSDVVDSAIFVADVSSLSGSYSITATFSSPGQDSSVIYAWNLSGGLDPTTPFASFTGTSVSATSLTVSSVAIPDGGMAFAAAALGAQSAIGPTFDGMTLDEQISSGGNTDDHKAGFASQSGPRSAATETLNWVGTSSKNSCAIGVLY